MTLKTLTLVAGLISFSPRIHAQEILTSYEFLGFSDDLKYCAFEVYFYAVLEDPAFSKIYFIDVDKNDYSMKPVVSEINEEGEDAVARVRIQNRKKAEPYLKNYKISGKKPGTPITLKSEASDRGPLFDDSQTFIIRGQQYTLNLSTVPTGNTSFDDRPEVMAVVDLVHNRQKKTLQQATKAPQSWGFIIGYQFLSVYFIENKIAVFVEYQGPGFEGYPDRQQMIVTGVLN